MINGPSPPASASYAATTGTAKGLLLTILGELVMPSPSSSMWSGALVELGQRLGFEDKALRQALARSSKQGWLHPERVGRRTLWHLDPAVRGTLLEGASRIYSHPLPGSPSGEWLIVLTRVPDSARARRMLLRKLFTWAGLGSPAAGIWIGAHPERITEVSQAINQAGAERDAHVFVSRYLPITASAQGGGERALPEENLTTLVESAWNLDEVAVEYRNFCRRWEALDPVGRPDPLVTQVSLVHHWRRFPWIDPALPLHLLPREWPGSRAEAVFRSLHNSLQRVATAEWMKINS